MRHCLFLLLIFLITGCTLEDLNPIYKPSEKKKLADEIRTKVTTKLKREKDLHPCGSGGGMMHEIKMLALSFDYYKQIDIDEARELLIIAVNEFVDAINADEKIRPYLYHYPFEHRKVEIRIFIRNPDGSRVENGKLCVVSAIESILEYSTHDPDDRLLNIHEETYEEALKKISDVPEKTDLLEKEVIQKSA